MPERWVLNASPLISLARIGQEGLFQSLAERVVLPRAVVNEIEAGPADDPARSAITTGKLTVVETPPPPAELQAWDLGDGEMGVLSYAVANPGWTVVVDDAAARKCARSFSLPLKGTLAVILLARQRGLVSSAAELLWSLQQAGFRLDDSIIRDALARVTGEIWPPRQG